MLAVRLAKIVLVAAVALHASLVAFGNITDYGTNWLFVQHVLSMDTIFPTSTIRYRAIGSTLLQQAAYLLIIATEVAIAALCWAGAWRRASPRCSPCKRSSTWAPPWSSYPSPG